MSATDMRALGRLGRPAGSPTKSRGRSRVRRSGSITRRRSRVPRPMAVLLVLMAIGGLWLGVAASRQSGSSPGDGAALTGIEKASDVGAAGTPVSGGAPPRVFATVEGLRLVLPSSEANFVAFGDSGFAEALTLAPVEPEVGSQSPPPAHEGASPAPGSAADVVVPPGAPVLAPVTGRVVEVAHYPVSGTDGDVRILLRPDGHDELAVLLLHLQQPQVRPGDAVTAGVTQVATVRALPSATDIGRPHVRVEVKAALEAPPVDPNAPALPADATP